jgi:hypothetical protein
MCGANEMKALDVPRRQDDGKGRTMTTRAAIAVRRGIALLLCPAVLLQACTAAIAPGSFPSENELDRGVIDGTIGLKADPSTAQHLVDTEQASRLRDAGVIPLRIIIRNLGTREVIVESAGMTLKLHDGRVLQATAAPALRLAERARLENAPNFGSRSSVSETPPSIQPLADLQAPPNDSEVPPVEPLATGKEASPLEPPAPDKEVPPVEPQATDKEAPPIEPQATGTEALKRFGKEMGTAALGGLVGGVMIYVLAAAVMTSPIWGPPVLISRYVKKKSEEKKRKAEEERFRTSSLEQLEEVHLFQDEAAGGLLYFAVEGDRPDTLATATLIVPVHDADTGEVHSVRLPLGVGN